MTVTRSITALAEDTPIEVSVVMPAYNEAGRICENALQTSLFLAGTGRTYEVIIVDDGSTDGTHAEALKAKELHPQVIRVIRYPENRGKGCAVLCGANQARGKYIVFLDADLDISPDQMLSHFDLFDNGSYDVVVGSKLHPQSEINYPKWRRIMLLGYFLFVRMLFGLPIRDTQTGIKTFRRHVLDRVAPLLKTDKFAFDVELLYLAHRSGYRMTDAPVKVIFRRGVLGRINSGDVRTVFLDTLRIFYRLRIAKRTRFSIQPGASLLGTLSEELHIEPACVQTDETSWPSLVSTISHSHILSINQTAPSSES